MWRKRNVLALLVGMSTDTATMEDVMEVPYKARNKTTIWPNNPTSRHISWGNQNLKRHMYPTVHYSTIYRTALFIEHGNECENLYSDSWPIRSGTFINNSDLNFSSQVIGVFIKLLKYFFWLRTGNRKIGTGKKYIFRH